MSFYLHTYAIQFNRTINDIITRHGQENVIIKRSIQCIFSMIVQYNICFFFLFNIMPLGRIICFLFSFSIKKKIKLYLVHDVHRVQHTAWRQVSQHDVSIREQRATRVLLQGLLVLWQLVWQHGSLEQFSIRQHWIRELGRQYNLQYVWSHQPQQENTDLWLHHHHVPHVVIWYRQLSDQLRHSWRHILDGPVNDWICVVKIMNYFNWVSKVYRLKIFRSCDWNHFWFTNTFCFVNFKFF